MGRAPKLCGKLECFNLVRGQPYCSEHTEDWGGRHDGSGAQRTAVYQRLRKRILRRDGYQCQIGYSDICLRKATEVDHILPHVAGGGDTEDNLQAVCRRCHHRKSSQEGHSERTR